MTTQLPSHDLAHIAVLIPAWQPEPRFLPLVDELVSRGFGAILIIDDGSHAGRADIFAALAAIPKVQLLTHAVNLGKGRALKTGINAFLCGLPCYTGLVTADADGQHTPQDIARVAEALDGRVVLGSRTFSSNVPFRSRFGNTLTRHLFGFVTGTKLADTQTGLRAFPRSVLPSLMTLQGERYEYEMTVLAHLCRTGSRPVEVPIQTVYLDDNRGSHFDPIRDSMRIYFVLGRFYLSSIAASGIDFAGFSLAFAATHQVLASVIFGRLSSVINFALNKRFVFRNQGSVKGTLLRYYTLVIAIAAVSYGFLWLLSQRAHWNIFAAKIIVDVLLSLVSFSVQRTFVFRKPEVR